MKHKLSMVLALLVALSMMLAACGADPTEAPAPDPTKAPEAEPTKAPEAEPTKAAEADPDLSLIHI